MISMAKLKLTILSILLLSCNYHVIVTHKIEQPDHLGSYINESNYARQEFNRGVLTTKQYQDWIERENRAYDILDSNKILYDK